MGAFLGLITLGIGLIKIGPVVGKILIGIVAQGAFLGSFGFKAGLPVN